MAEGGADPEAQMQPRGRHQPPLTGPPPLRYHGDFTVINEFKSSTPSKPKHQSNMNPNIAYLESLVKEQSEQMAILQEQLEHYKSEYSNSFSSPPTPVIVEMPHHPRLKTFTGLPASGGNETNFKEWLEQAEIVLLDNNCRDKRSKIINTLKGLALSQVRHINSAEDIVSALTTTFGEVKSAEDLYLTFSETKIEKKEQASSFLLRLWDNIIFINKTTQFSPREVNVKLYRTFIRGLDSNHSLLCLELRSMFGFPGTAGPEPSEVLRAVRLAESAPLQEVRPRVQAQSATSSRAQGPPPSPVPPQQWDAVGLSEEDVDRLTNQVAQLLPRK